jgi:hypothetical protein
MPNAKAESGKHTSDSTILCGHLEPNIVGQVLSFYPGFQDEREHVIIER